jgi:hypothetical protein
MHIRRGDNTENDGGGRFDREQHGGQPQGATGWANGFHAHTVRGANLASEN